MNSLRTASAAMAGLAVILLIVVQFTPWASSEQNGFGASSKISYYTWEAEMEGSFGGFSGEDSHGWYSNDADDAAGVDQIRIAIPLLLVGLLVILAGAILTVGTKTGLGPILTMVSALILAAGVILFAIGADSSFEDAKFSWGIAFYFAIAGGALAFLSGITGLMSGNRM